MKNWVEFKIGSWNITLMLGRCSKKPIEYWRGMGCLHNKFRFETWLFGVIVFKPIAKREA